MLRRLADAQSSNHLVINLIVSPRQSVLWSPPVTHERRSINDYYCRLAIGTTRKESESSEPEEVSMEFLLLFASE